MASFRDRASRLQPPDGPASGTTEGRRAPRLHVSGQIRGHLVALNKPVKVTEVGLDGFRIETTVELAVGAIHEFRWGVSDRGASIRIPMQTAKDGKGYLEDRRPAANMDPYQVCAILVETVCS